MRHDPFRRDLPFRRIRPDRMMFGFGAGGGSSCDPSGEGGACHLAGYGPVPLAPQPGYTPSPNDGVMEPACIPSPIDDPLGP
jgi:hypothetical protein